MKSIFLNHLKSGLLKAKGETATFAEATVDALEAMDAVKANKPESVSITLLASDWASGSGLERWPYYYDISNENITEADYAAVTILPDSAGAAPYHTGLGHIRQPQEAAASIKACPRDGHKRRVLYHQREGECVIGMGLHKRTRLRGDYSIQHWYTAHDRRYCRRHLV